MWEFINPFIFFIFNVGKMWENKKITRFIKYQSLLFQCFMVRPAGVEPATSGFGLQHAEQTYILL